MFKEVYDYELSSGNVIDQIRIFGLQEKPASIKIDGKIQNAKIEFDSRKNVCINICKLVIKFNAE